MLPFVLYQSAMFHPITRFRNVACRFKLETNPFQGFLTMNLSYFHQHVRGLLGMACFFAIFIPLMVIFLLRRLSRRLPFVIWWLLAETRMNVHTHAFKYSKRVNVVKLGTRCLGKLRDSPTHPQSLTGLSAEC